MRKRKKVMLVVLSLLAVMVLSIFIPMLTTPMRRPTSMVRNYILRITPIGTSIEDMIKIAGSRDDWDIRHINLGRGFQLGPPNITVIGEMSARVHLGTYFAWYKWFPLMEWAVDVFWGFDEDGRLIEVHIQKLGMI